MNNTKAPGRPPLKTDAQNMEKINTIVEQTMESSGETVSIACKIPMGLILHVFKKSITPTKMESGAIRDVEGYDRFGKEYRIYGPSHPQDGGPHCLIVGDYAITPNIPKEHWDLWFAQHRNDDMVINRMIFANSTSKVGGQAKEQKDLKSGLERRDPNKLPETLTPDREAMNPEVFNRMMSSQG